MERGGRGGETFFFLGGEMLCKEFITKCAIFFDERYAPPISLLVFPLKAALGNKEKAVNLLLDGIKRFPREDTGEGSEGVLPHTSKRDLAIFHFYIAVKGEICFSLISHFCFLSYYISAFSLTLPFCFS